ncbi:membrane protein insertase YidC [Clostridium sp. SHJSY1]|uniref:membrane protein insertase YidC n=1 Tax=Clostridium sp. SHJSY1 TaxID=2942483 RepID=UPI002875F02F|nr:membrane protein insertase YidC [Clostridium sp. SHJSY1]MDS0527931.1 membrane protein insertase YidC [Clostridium sp. SHJSY1]
MMTLFAPITNVFKEVFLWLHDFVVGLGVTGGLSYVLAITILTIVIRGCLLPFNIKSANSMRGMQEIQPEVKKLQEKYKGDPQRANAELMKLYKERNVSMTGGCVPALLPLPILMALYYAFYNIDINESFLWINSLGAPDQLHILPIFAALSTYLPSYLMGKATPNNGEGAMNMGPMNIGMSLMMGFMAWNFKSILVIYWVLGGVIQLATTYFINYKPAMAKKNEVMEVEAEKEATRAPKFVMPDYDETNKSSKKKKKKK